MTTLGQIVGVHKGIKTQVQRDWDSAYHTLQKGDLFIGFEKVHEPYEGNLPQPPQIKRVQANAHDILSELQPLLTRLIDLEATKDNADTLARADVKIGGQVIIPDAPISHLLWLIKQFSNLVTVFRSIPVMSAAEDWQEAEALPEGMRRTPAETTPSTKKVEEWKVIVPATDKHPADVRQVREDIQSGTWTTVKFTAAIPSSVRDTLVRRASQLLEATQQAAVDANRLEVTDVREGDRIFEFLYGEVL